MSHLLDIRQISGAAEEMGYCSLAPDQLLMLQEEQQALLQAHAEEDEQAEQMTTRCECISSILQVITRDAQSVEEIRNRVAAIVVQVLPDLLIGQRIWHGRAELNRLRSVAIQPFVWEEAAGSQLLRLIVAKGWESREVGKRALFLLYGTERNSSLRPPMARSFASMGRAIGLKAKNPRSAISAAIQAMLGELLQSAQRRVRTTTHQKFWFSKNATCCERLSVSMKGKKNRKKKGGPNV